MKKSFIIIVLLCAITLSFAINQSDVKRAIQLDQKIREWNLLQIQDRLQAPSVIYFDYMMDEEWTENEKMELSYQNNLLQYATTSHKNEESVYIPFMRYAYSYNNNNQTTLVTYQMNANMSDPNADPIWIDFMMMQFIYNNGHISKLYMLDAEGNASNRMHYTYQNNQIKYIYGAEYDENQGAYTYWRNEFFITDGKLNYSIESSSADSSSWAESEKIIYTYHSSDNSDYSDLQYILDHTFVYPYYYYSFTGVRVVQEITQAWNGTGWEPTDKTIYSFDSNWNVGQEFSYVFQGGAWLEENAVDIFYLNANQINHIVDSYWSGGIQQMMQRSRFNYSTDTDIPAVMQTQLKMNLYPNPIDINSRIKLSNTLNQNVKVSLYDVKGRQIASKDFVVNKELEIESSQLVDQKQLSSGIYFLKADNGQEVVTKKVMKVK